MKISKVKKIKDPVDRLVYWITEREKIRVQRLKGKPAPWTDDEILKSYRFCNVVRLDDKVSKWLMENWYKPNFNHPNMLMACAVARHFNKPEFLDRMGFPAKYNPQKWYDYATDHINDGHKCFNSAYIITGKCFTNTRYDSKIETVIYSTIRQFDESPIDPIPNTMQKFVEELVDRYELIGSFMAGQIAADYRHATNHVFKDRKYWAAIGPGSRRGMNRIMNRDLKYPLRQPEFTDLLKWLIEKIRPRLSDRLQSKMEGIDYQNCLCEYDKYSRTLEGQGRPKQRYTPPNSEKPSRGRIG